MKALSTTKKESTVLAEEVTKATNYLQAVNKA